MLSSADGAGSEDSVPWNAVMPTPSAVTCGSSIAPGHHNPSTTEGLFRFFRRLGDRTHAVKQAGREMNSSDHDDAIREGDPPNLPRSNGISRSDISDESRKTGSFTWLLPVPICLILGSVLLAPFARSPGDPSGHIISAGWGGAIGLVVALIWRLSINRP